MTRPTDVAMTQPQQGNRPAEEPRLTYESPAAPLGLHGSLVYLRDGDTLTVTGPHSDALERWPRLKRVLGFLLGAGLLMISIGAMFGGLTIDLTADSFGVRGDALGRLGVYLTGATGAAIVASYLLLSKRRGRVTVEADRDAITYSVHPANGPDRTERWPAGDVVDVAADSDGGVILHLRDRRQVKLYLGRNHGESMRLAEELNRARRGAGD
jgi:hypothetical protein